jgi:predicted secreted acid phosphatase
VKSNHLWSLLFLTFFASAAVADVVTPPARDEPINLSVWLDRLKSYHDSGRYERDIAYVDGRAQEYIRTRSAGKKLAIVLDIDETSLSNWDEMIADGFAYFPGIPCAISGGKPTSPCGALAWDKLEQAQAIGPTLSVFRFAVAHGMTVFFITGRHEAERSATEQNLVKAGYRGWNPKNLLMEPDDMHVASAADFKAPERKFIEETLGYTIVVNIGDQWSDLSGGYAEKDFKLPNPFYYIP